MESDDGQTLYNIGRLSQRFPNVAVTMFNNYIVLGVYNFKIMIENRINATDVQVLVANRERKEYSIKELGYDGDNWAGTYDPATKVMQGGARIDGETSDNEFKISEVEEANAQDALKYCAGLYLDYTPNGIAMSFKELQNTYEESCRKAELIHSLEKCSWVE